MNSETDNIYRLDGRIPVSQAIPFGLQHILAMFVANIAPIMIVAGIGTLIQLFPLWKIGSSLPCCRFSRSLTRTPFWQSS